MKKLLLFPVFCLVLFFTNCNKVKEPTSYPFAIIHDNLDSSKNTAVARDQNIFLMVHADWCSICNNFKATVLQSTAVKDQLANSITTSLIDGDKTYGKPIATQYGVAGFPTLFILDKNGAVLAKNIGALDEAAFLAWVKPFLK